MSNPFAMFRKNQKLWMAGAVLIAILAFIIGPAISTATQSFVSGANNDLVVRWNGGKVSVNDLRLAMDKHAMLVRFLYTLAQEVVDGNGQPQIPGFSYDPASNQVMAVGIQTSSDAYSVCRTRYLATYAEEMGVRFGDETVDEFIRGFCDNKIATDRLQTILSESSDGRLTYFEVREMLKQELAALVVQQTAYMGLNSISPGKTYQDFLKLNQTAKIEAYALTTDDYLDNVSGSPSDQELQAIYDTGITRLADATSAEPGFVQPYMANVQYIEGNLENWVEREKAKLTDEALQAEYDKRVNLGQLQIPVEPAPTEEENTGDSAETGVPANDTEGEAAVESEESPSGGDSPADGEPQESTGTESGTTEASGGDAGSSEDTGSSGEATEEESNKAPEEDQSSVAPGKTRLVAFQQEETSAQEENASNSNETANAETESAETTSSEQVSEEATTEDQAGDASGAEGTAAEGEQATAAEGEETNAQADAVPAAPAMRTQTFEEAREQIADDLARAAARTALDQAMAELLNDVMKAHYSSYRQYQAFVDSGIETDESGEAPTPPKAPNLKELAEARGLTVNETTLIDGQQLAQLPIGQGMIMQDAAGLSGSVANALMNPAMELYRPIQAIYFDQALLMQGGTPDFLQLLAWKIEDKQAYIPELVDIREDVVDAWKLQRAAELAQNAATELAGKVGGGEDPWADALDETQRGLVVETNPFPWISRFGEGIQISPVTKLDGGQLEGIGNDFMKSVFATPAGQASSAPSYNRSTYYVFRVVELNPSETDLQARFNADPIKSGAMQLGRSENAQLSSGWLQEVERELGVEWQMDVGQFN